MHRITRFLTARKTSWIPLAIAFIAAGAIFAGGSGAAGATAPGAGLAANVESARAAALQKQLPGTDSTSALIVFSRDGAQLTSNDQKVVRAKVVELAKFAVKGFAPPPTIAQNNTAALAVVPLTIVSNVADQASRAAALRETARAGLPTGLTALLTGPEGFQVDVAAVFKGADFSLLLTTVVVVALLLLVTYRSPWLWLVPLTVIGVADGLASIVATRVASIFGITLDASVTGILSVLVFGAGTNYALLLIARYRDELRSNEDRREAMATALRGAGPAIIASGSTVVLSLLTLIFAELSGNRALGIACAVGIVIAMVFALLVLPATLLLFGRRLFWPYTPKFGSKPTTQGGVWFRLGTGVSRRPVAVVIVGVLLLGGLALAAPSIHVGLAQTQKFTKVPESVSGQTVIAAAFSAGSGSPAAVIVNTPFADTVVTAAKSVPGVQAVTIGASNGVISQINVTLSAAAETPKAFAAIKNLRAAVGPIVGANALVGGLDAQTLDVKSAQEHDQNYVIPLILGLVFLVLVLLLRSLIAPILLLATVVASYFASLGASWLLFTSVFGFPAVDTNVILFSFLFLVALGVDYNIFLVTRAREEAVVHGTRGGMIRALSSTGGVITSAGILLAAVFAVLGVLPLITLTQIGIIVCVGVLLDTLVVRTVIVPALAFIVGEKFWWPSRPHAVREVEVAVPVLSRADPTAITASDQPAKKTAGR